MTEHTTHYEDCGCLSERFAERIAELERDNRNMHSLNDGMRETVAELEANAEELMAEVKMYGAANGELKDALDKALTELAALKERHCETCRQHMHDDWCAALEFDTDPEFGCVQWEPKS